MHCSIDVVANVTSSDLSARSFYNSVQMCGSSVLRNFVHNLGVQFQSKLFRKRYNIHTYGNCLFLVLRLGGGVSSISPSLASGSRGVCINVFARLGGSTRPCAPCWEQQSRPFLLCVREVVDSSLCRFSTKVSRCVGAGLIYRSPL